MTLDAYIVLALYALGAWFVADHVLNHRKDWEKYPDLGEVDLHDAHRNRVAQDADDARLVNESSSAVRLCGRFKGLATDDLGCQLIENHVGDCRPYHARAPVLDLRTRLHQDIVTRRERMRDHRQRIEWR